MISADVNVVRAPDDEPLNAVAALLQYLADTGVVQAQPHGDTVSVHVSFDIAAEIPAVVFTQFYRDEGRLHIVTEWAPTAPVKL